MSYRPSPTFVALVVFVVAYHLAPIIHLVTGWRAP